MRSRFSGEPDYSRSWTNDLNGVNYQKGMQFTTGMVLRMGTW